MRVPQSLVKLAAVLWLASLQYFIVQFIVAQRWRGDFSLRHNTISDLGNTVCGSYGARLVCSPLHNLMNASFAIQGGLMAGGALILLRGLPFLHRWARIGLVGLVLAGLGTSLVGLFPENTISSLHVLGAGLPFVLGNVALIMLSFSLQLPSALRVYTGLSGSIALAALGFFMTQHGFGLGTGGMERLTAYPQTIWLVVVGGYLYWRHEPAARAEYMDVSKLFK